VLELNPSFSEAHAQIGNAYAATRQVDLAIQHWKEECRIDPNSSYGYRMIGLLALVNGRAEEALEMYRLATERTPYNAEVSFRLGLAHERLSHLSDATEAYRRATTIDPNHAGAWQHLADILRRQGKAEEAVAPAQRAVKLTRSENADVLMTLAEVYASAGRRSEADEFASKSLSAASPEQLDAIRTRFNALRTGK
jgi:tetratricopeptide (TPR) repeat protein